MQIGRDRLRGEKRVLYKICTIDYYLAKCYLVKPRPGGGTMLRNQVDYTERLGQVQHHIDKMPSLSTTVTKVLEICNRPDTSANDMNRVISLDPVLTGKVLKLINSAYYSLPNQVTSLTRAIIILGLNTVKNLALSTAILGNLRNRKSKALPIDAFWDHSIRAGVTAKAIASLRKDRSGPLEEYFIAGLLHDLGKIPLSDCFPKEYQKAVNMIAAKDGTAHHAEKTFFGFDHCLTGKMIAEKWKFADGFVEALAHHHAPQMIEGDHSNLVANVVIGNHFAHFIERPDDENQTLLPAGVAQALEVAGIEWQDVLGLDDEINTEIEKARIFLEIGIGG